MPGSFKFPSGSPRTIHSKTGNPDSPRRSKFVFSSSPRSARSPSDPPATAAPPAMATAGQQQRGLDFNEELTPSNSSRSKLGLFAAIAPLPPGAVKIRDLQQLPTPKPSSASATATGNASAGEKHSSGYSMPPSRPRPSSSNSTTPRKESKLQGSSAAAAGGSAVHSAGGDDFTTSSPLKRVRPLPPSSSSPFSRPTSSSSSTVPSPAHHRQVTNSPFRAAIERQEAAAASPFRAAPPSTPPPASKKKRDKPLPVSPGQMEAIRHGVPKGAFRLPALPPSRNS